MKHSAATVLVSFVAIAPLAAEPIDYVRDVKPILAEKCYACHGALKQESGLRLDTGAVIRKGGDTGPAIVSGKPDESLLLKRVSAETSDERMPPEGEGERLDARQLAIVRQWIAEGATAPHEPLPPDPREHWAFVPPVRPGVPSASESDWPATAIDAFIAARHKEQGLTPNVPAAKNILLRRAYLDLIGLPPSPDQLHAFLSDESPDAYERVIDQLLARPQYGERWGRHWMDVWRYSDWAGYKQDVRESQRHIWRWRDWIIESLNSDKSYDRMVVEMLAGDELAPGNRDVLRATGFLVRNRHNSNRNIWLDATVEHTAKAFLGLTINCARCHDHKYDPLPQTAYYQMRAIFETHDVAIERLPGQSDLVKEGFVRVFDGKLNDATYVYHRGDEKKPDKEHPVSPGLPDMLPGQLAVRPVSIPFEARHPLLKSEFRDEDLAAARKSAKQAETALAKAREAAAADSDDAKAQAVEVAEAKLAVTQSELESLEARWTADFAKYADKPAAGVEELARLAAQAERKAALCKAELAFLQAEQALATAQKNEKSDDQKTKVALTKAENDHKKAQETLDKARAELDQADDKYTSIAKPYPETSSGRRLALARWITGPQNPLTARVAINHLWLRHFGAPLVDNVFDFGLRTPRPALAEALDWLAVEFADRDYSMKHIHRLLVTSATYQRSSANPQSPIPNPQSIDPDNRLLWRANTRRLEAELVRDGLLYLGGNLDLAHGGPDIDGELGETSRRRSVYFRHAYEKQMKFLMLFDAANVNECYRRSESVIPQQALAIANSTLSFTQSRFLARELTDDAPLAENDRFIQAAFEHTLSRPPTTAEQSRCDQFLSEQTTRLRDTASLTTFVGGTKSDVPPSNNPAQRARENLIHVLLNHNDFVTIR